MLIDKFNWENAIDERNRKEEEWQTFRQSLSEAIDKINELVGDINSLTHKYDRLSNKVSNIEDSLEPSLWLVPIIVIINQLLNVIAIEKINKWNYKWITLNI